MTGDREDARRHLTEFLDADDSSDAAVSNDAVDERDRFDARLGALARRIVDQLGRRASTSFTILDNILRTEITRPVNLDEAVFGGDPERVPVLLWELKRTCLTRVLGCLPPSVRVAFVLTHIFSYPPGAASDLLNIRESAYRVRLTRARKRVEDFLGPRCEHLNPINPCNCAGRLAIALEQGFVEFPPHTIDTPLGVHNERHTGTDVLLLYRGLPGVEPVDPDSRGEALEGCDRLRAGVHGVSEYER